MESEIMKYVIEGFVFAEFVIGVSFTLWLVVKKMIFPVIDFIVEYWSSYGEFREWRKRNA